MVTFCFFLVFLILLMITSIFDMLVYKKNILESLYALLYAYIGAGRYIAYIGAGVGLISSIIIDYRLHKNKKMKNTTQTDLS